jgi:hypothetical protein
MGVVVVRRVAVKAAARMEISMMRDGNGFELRWRELVRFGNNETAVAMA